MRLVVNGGIAKLRRGLIAAGLLALTAGSASAQMVFDGNVLFNNNATGTLAGQFVGAPTAAAGCPGGYDAATLGTVTFTRNIYADPLLPTAVYQPNVVPSFVPGIGSPAFNKALTLPSDGFFQQTCYSGAIGPNPGDDWTQGWTYYDSTGANRQDLHLVGMPNPRPLAVYANFNCYGHAHWSPDSNYLVRGQLRVKSQASLTIAPGVVVFEERATLGTIVVERGGQIWAIGNACEPIIVTSDDAPGSQTPGAGGGIVMNGYAKVSNVNSCAGDSAASEGGAIGFYGGSNDDDNSGQLRYVRVEFAGKEITPNNELNSFTFNGIGRKTRVEYLEAFMGVDDDFEFFGGTLDLKHAIGIDGRDDGFDWQMGYRGRAQFVVIRCCPFKSPAGTQNGDKGIEADNNENDFPQVQCAGRSNATVANFTMVGDKRSGPTMPGPSSAVNLRNGTAGSVLNSICYAFKTAGLKIDVDETWRAHCLAIPSGPGIFCPGALGVLPIVSGDVFVARSSPNPFRNNVNVSFTLPQSGPVSVEIYSADGRHVQTLVDRELQAGPHTFAWNVDHAVPSGVYFYKVLASGTRSTGKISRVN